MSLNLILLRRQKNVGEINKYSWVSGEIKDELKQKIFLPPSNQTSTYIAILLKQTVLIEFHWWATNWQMSGETPSSSKINSRGKSVASVVAVAVTLLHLTSLYRKPLCRPQGQKCIMSSRLMLFTPPDYVIVELATFLYARNEKLHPSSRRPKWLKLIRSCGLIYQSLLYAGNFLAIFCKGLH